jgi:hypothetical protein
MVQRQLFGLEDRLHQEHYEIKKREMWRAEYISTAVSNKLQAEFGTAPEAEGGKMQHSCVS